MFRGTKPQPKAIKKLHHSRKPINEREPQPVGNVAEPPDHFTEDQIEIWRYAVKHSPTGMLKLVDASALEVWCVAVAMHRTAVAELKKADSLMTVTPNGHSVQSPYVSIVNKQAEIMMRTASALGFVPTSRPRIGLSGGDGLSGKYVPAAEEESLAEYLDRAPDPAVH